jgi:hypothetical protein
MKLFRLLLSRDWKDRGSVIENVLKDEERYSWDRGRLARNEREARMSGTDDLLSAWRIAAGETPAVPAIALSFPNSSIRQFALLVVSTSKLAL